MTDQVESKEQGKKEVIVQKAANKLAIVGCSESKDQAPFDDPNFEIWGVNNLFYHIPRYTRWFEIHRITHDGVSYARRGEKHWRGQTIDKYMADLGQMECPIYMQKHWAEVPNSIPYPLQKVLDVFGNYVTNTISWMTALGILEDFEEIHIYGVDMAVDSEYHWQRPSCEYFIGWFNGMCYAKGLKTRVYIPASADLCKARFLYGFQEAEETAWQKKLIGMRQGMKKRLREAEIQEDMYTRKKQQYIGAMEALKEIDKVWK